MTFLHAIVTLLRSSVTPCVSEDTMDASDSFYEFDPVTKTTFSDSNLDAVQPNFLQPNNRESSLRFGDLELYNEESIDLERYLHLGNTPPNGNGDELLKQFGAYSSSPPVTVSIKPVANNTSSISQGLASVSLAATHSHSQVPSVVQAALSSTATTTQLGFQIKQEVVEEHSVPELYQDSEMPPGEEQTYQIAQGEQGNLGGQQVYLTLAQGHSDEVTVTTSTATEPFNQAYTMHTESSNQPEVGGSAGKKRQRPAINKDSDEYKTKRIRNNIAVRKSREKSKARNKDLQSKVQTLQTENDKLNKKVELLTKELTVLRSLFTTVKPNSASQ